MSKSTNIKLISVAFDTDGDKRLAKKLEKQWLGKVFTVDHEEDEDPLDLFADAVSYQTGFCVFSLSGTVDEEMMS